MKGKTLTGLVLVIEIASIAILHAVKINHSERTATKELSRSLPAAEALDTRAKPAISLAVLK
jgi:hypothetical protein